MLGILSTKLGPLPVSGWAAIFAIVLPLVALTLSLMTRRRLRKPVICVCELNGRVFVVLREDYDKASRSFWRSCETGLELLHYGAEGLGCYIPVNPVFVFTRHSKMLTKLQDSCYVERAFFWGPDGSIFQRPVDDLAAAWQHIHGRPLPNPVT